MTVTIVLTDRLEQPIVIDEDKAIDNRYQRVRETEHGVVIDVYENRDAKLTYIVSSYEHVVASRTIPWHRIYEILRSP